MTFDNVLIFIINTLIIIIEAFLALRFFLKLLGASQEAPFVQWTYDLTASLLEPFQNMFPSPTLGRYFTIEFTTLFAMLVYAVFGFFFVRLIELMFLQIMNLIESSKPRKPKHDIHQNHTLLNQ